MIVLDTQGIVLRAVKYRDKDLILTIFTRKYGKVSAIAKGAQGQKSRFLSFCKPAESPSIVIRLFVPVKYIVTLALTLSAIFSAGPADVLIFTLSR